MSELFDCCGHRHRAVCRGGSLACDDSKRICAKRNSTVKRKSLYVAAQNRMSELRAGGYESLYQYDENKKNGVAKAGLIPLDAPEEDAEDAITKDTLCYVVSANRVEVGKAADSVLPESSVDAELWNNHWVIEYEPESGSVYSAFTAKRRSQAAMPPLRCPHT